MKHKIDIIESIHDDRDYTCNGVSDRIFTVSIDHIIMNARIKFSKCNGPAAWRSGQHNRKYVLILENKLVRKSKDYDQIRKQILLLANAKDRRMSIRLI